MHDKPCFVPGAGSGSWPSKAEMSFWAYPRDNLVEVVMVEFAMSINRQLEKSLSWRKSLKRKVEAEDPFAADKAATSRLQSWNSSKTSRKPWIDASRLWKERCIGFKTHLFRPQQRRQTTAARAFAGRMPPTSQSCWAA